MRCKARTLLGYRCTRPSKEDSLYCFQHQSYPQKRRQYLCGRIALWIGIIGSFASIIGLLILLIFPSDTEYVVLKMLEELVAVPFDEYISLDNRLKELAKEQGKTPEQLKDEIDEWIEQVKTPYEKGLAALYRQKYQEAEDYLNESIESSKQELAVKYFYRGNAQSFNQKLDLAIESYKKAIQIRPDYANVHNNLGSNYAEQGKLDLAIESYKKAIQINPNLGYVYDNLRKTYYNLGVAYYNQGKHSEAIESYKKAIQINPDYAKAYYNLGVVYYNQGRHSEAIESYKKAIQINPADAETLNNLGNIYAKQGKLDLAIESYKEAIAISQNLVYIYYGLACAYSLKNEKTLSIQSLQRAVALDKKYIEMLKRNSDFDNIRESPEFQQIINSVK